MSAKHTPGPWTTTPSGEASFIPLRAHHCEKLGFCIGFVNYDINDGQGSIPEANARLIAAAPELLIFAQNVSNGVIVPELMTHEGLIEVILGWQKAASAAITKAEGGKK